MKLFHRAPSRSPRQEAQARSVLLGIGALLALLAGGAFWYLRSTGQPGNQNDSTAEVSPADSPTLSAATRSIIGNLRVPVEIRFYCSLEQASRLAELAPFAQRVQQLLSRYEQAAGGKIGVTRQDPLAQPAAEAAAVADGVKPWMLEGGGVCYLGLAVVQGNQTESLPRLAPEWEAALEPDVTRAIVRVTRPSVSAEPSPAQSEAAAVAVRELEQSVPNLASASMEEGARILRESTLQQFISTVKETQPQIDALEQRMREMQGEATESERQSLLEELQRLRADQKAKLDEIAARMDAQVAALEQLKGVTKQPAARAEDRSPTRPTR